MKEVIIILAGIGLIGAAVVALGEVVSKLFTKTPSKVEVRRSRRSSLSDLYCPISRELMTHPVKIRQCGHTFQKKEISRWLSEKKTCPLCRIQADPEDLIKNPNIKNLVQKAIEEGQVEN